MGGNPGPSPFGPAPGGYGSGAFGGGSTYGGPSQYAIGNPANTWGPMGASGYPQTTGGHSAAFDNRATEAAFTSAGSNAPPAHNASGPYGGGAAAYGTGLDGQSDPFAFLNSGMGGLSMNDNDTSRRNGANSAKSPPA
jgi:hypothetical protein